MKTKIILFTLSITLTSNLTAQEGHFRPLFHAHGNDRVDLAAWTLAPDVTTRPSKWINIVGPTYNGQDWNIETMGGVMIDSLQITSLIDMRLTIKPKKFNLPFGIFLNPQWIDPRGGGEKAYCYLSLNRNLIPKKATFALETENVWQKESKPNLSFGPGLIFSIKQFALQTFYQWHSTGPNQIWIRTKIEL